MKTLILHMGLQKTGSTSIQETFLENPEVLPRFGFDYFPLVWPDGTINSNHSFPLLASFTDGWEDHGEVTRRGWRPEGLKAHFRGEVARMLSTGRNLVVSGEDITDLGEDGLRRFAAMAEARGFAIRPVILVRAPLAFFTSMTQTRIRHGVKFELYTSEKASLIAMCLRIWPDMICLPFARAADHPDGALGVLLEACGLPAAREFDAVTQNESLSEFATRLIGHLNNVVPLYAGGAVDPRRFYLDTEPLAGIPGPKFIFTRDEFLAVRPVVQSENAALARLLGPAFCDPDFRFKPMPEAWTDAALEALARALPDLPPVLRGPALGYFSQSSQVTPADRARAEAILGPIPG